MKSSTSENDSKKLLLESNKTDGIRGGENHQACEDNS